MASFCQTVAQGNQLFGTILYKLTQQIGEPVPCPFTFRNEDGIVLPEGFAITKGTHEDGRPTYTVTYNK